MADLRLKIGASGSGTCVALWDCAKNVAILQATGPAPPAKTPDAPTPAQLKAIGRRLAKTLFPGEIEPYLAVKLWEAKRLWLDVEDGLKDVPWEFALLDGVPLYECQRIAVARGQGSGPLISLGRRERRTLIVTANPGAQGHPHLSNVEDEVESLCAILGENPPKVLRDATEATLRQAVDRVRPQVVHFIGHGGIDQTGGYLLLADGKRLYGDRLGALLKPHAPRLVVLSACRTAGNATSVGARLVASGVPVVVGMQARIRDTKTLPFVRALYISLAEGRSLDVAVRHGREACDGHVAGIPVLLAGPGAIGEKDSGDGPTNVVLDPQPFVGRRADVDGLCKMLREGQRRLVTLYGLGGMGKTSLSKQVAVAVAPDFSGGAWFVECDRLADGDLLLSSIGKALKTDADSVEGIAECLEGRPTLIVVDCFERIVDRAPVLVDLLAKAPELRLLVTSRILLKVVEETEYELKPLAPGKKPTTPSERLDLLTDALEAIAVELPMTGENRKLAVELVDLLEGVPLAIVLAARRLRDMALAELLPRLKKQKLKLLANRSASQSDRHASIETVIRDSFDLLRPPEKEVAVQLSVFRGFFLSDLKTVFPDFENMEDFVFRLRDQSLLIARLEGRRMRYDSYDTVHEFMSDEAASHDLSGVRNRHALLFSRRGVLVRELFDAERVDDSKAMLWADLGNFMAATEFALSSGNCDLIVQLANSLARPFMELGLLSEFSRLTYRAERIAVARGNNRLLVKLHGLLGTLARRQRNFDEAWRRWQERATLCNRLALFDEQADSLLDCADLAVRNGDLDRARGFLDQYLVMECLVTKYGLRASARIMAADLALAAGDREEALHQAAEAERFAASSPDQDNTHPWINLARFYRKVEQPEDARRYLDRMIRVSLRCDYPHYVGVGLIELSLLADAANRPDQAARALVLARRTPRSSSGSLLPRVQARLKEHADKFGIQEIDEAKRRYRKGKWEPAVIELLDLET